jgi:uncharacterized protein
MRKKIFLAMFLLTIGNVYALENGVTIPLVADRMTDSGEAGAILSAQVIVTNGTGHVYVDTNPYTQVDLQGSARIAAMVASDVLGVDEKSYDFYYAIDIGSPIIGGPSAGGALTVATIAAMNNWKIKPGVVMTGMIDPDETIGPVGGIPFKLEAAATKNTSLFLVPQGQLVVNITNTTTVGRGSITTNSMTEDVVDLVALGKKLNIDVKEVSTIQDAVLEFTGHNISNPSLNKTVFTPNYLSLLEPLAIRLKNESKSMYKDTASIVNNSLIKNAENLQNRADDLVNNKKYYAATSLYFGSLINILTAQWGYEYDHVNNKEQYLTNLTKNVEEQVQNSENDLNKFKSSGIGDVEVVGAAESRIMLANNTLENAKNLKNPNDIISALANAHERARTAQWWLTLAVSSGKTIPEDILKERSIWYLSQAQSIGTYVQTLLAESGSEHATIGDMTLIQKEIDRGYYSGAIFDSLQAISRLSTGIGLSGINDPSIRINQSADAAQAAINEARSKGIEPTLAVSAYEFAGISTNPFDEISQYIYAKMVAKTTESLYSRAVVSNQTVTKPEIVIAKTTPIPTKKGLGFEGIALLVAILLIRKLKNK